MWLPATEFGGQNRATVAVGDGRQEVWVTVLRSASPLCTIASAGSIGREGAMVQLAAATGSWMGPLRGRQITPPCWSRGAAAGFASACVAALSGAIFIAEVVYGTSVICRLVILRAVYPWRNFPYALRVDFQKKIYALLCSVVARDESTKPIRSSQDRIP